MADIMEVTELAHWEYRVKAIERDIPQTNKLIASARSMARESRWPRDYMPTADEMRNPPPSVFDSDVEWLQELSKLERWLLEEARYKVTLGNTTNRERCSHPVYVMQIQNGEVSYTSVHRISETAEAKMYAKAEAWGLDPTRLDDYPEVRYGISRLEVEP